MTKTIYVGNLPWSTTEDSLSQAFTVHGPVQSCRIVTDRETGRSRGFGFVEVADEDTERIITASQGMTLDGRVLTVNEARERGPRRF